MFARGFVQASSRAGGGDPHPDALVLAETIAGVAAAGLDRFAAGELEAAIAGDIGVPIDAAGAIAAARANIGNLILVHGRLGRRPDGAEAFAVKPRLAANGKPGIWRIERLMDLRLNEPRDFELPVKPIRKDIYPPGSYCGLEFDPDPQLAANDRAEYLVWRLALEALAEALSGRLETITALPPAAALFPWKGEKDGDRPRDLFGSGAERIYELAEVRGLEAERRNGVRRPTSGRASDKARRPAKPAAVSARR
jgi:hypothetical protein